MRYTVQTIVCGAYEENAYLLCPENSRDALLIDPGDALTALEDALQSSGRSLRAILLTHGHFDHTLSAEPLWRTTGCPVYLSDGDAAMVNDPLKNAYDPTCAQLPCPANLETEAPDAVLNVCGLTFELLATPGHTPGSVCYYDRENARLFAGDTLFCAGFGRTDLPGGSPRDMHDSLLRLFALPEQTEVYCGHGPATTIGAERARYRL